MGEAAGIAAELDLVEQLSAANAAFRPAAREIIEEIAGRAGLWRRGASVRRRGERPPPKGGGFGLRLKAGLGRPRGADSRN